VRWQEIPETIDIGGEPWHVIWRSQTDADWKRLRCWGRTSVDGSDVIELCTRLKYMPSKLGEVWLHELGHACLYMTYIRGFVGEPNRPKAFNDKLEEKVITVLTGKLVECLNQTGWPKL
jgi:hypothetical protein